MFHLAADSGCDIFTLDGASFATAALTISTETEHFLDDDTLDTGRLAEHMQTYKGRSGTACPSTDAWLKAFSPEDGSIPDELYVVTMTSGLSGTFNSASVAVDMFKEQHPETRTLVIDSLSVGPEMRLILEKIVELKKNGLSFEEVSEKIHAYCRTTRLFFALKSLHNLAQNGRVSKLVAAAAGVLGISMCGTASPQGTIEPVGKARGDKNLSETIIREMKKAGFHGGKVRISHADNEKLAERLCNALKTLYPMIDIMYYPVRGLCSFYCERGGLLIGLETKKEAVASEN